VILVDTSVWVEDIRQTGSPSNQALRELLNEKADIAVTEPIVMELLAGARSRHEYITTRQRMLGFPMLRVGGLDTFERAALVWRACRQGGEPVRNGLDCVIAAVAIREGAQILHQDRDFDVIATHTELQVLRAS
jgi:predicted nucleic acid-binding protein